MNENKKKYLKYKAKYLHLKARREQTGGSSVSCDYHFETKSNTGRQDGYSNSCMYISLQDGLNAMGNGTHTLQSIRGQFNLQPYENNSMFDVRNQHHYQNLFTFANDNNVLILIFNVYWENNVQKISYQQYFPFGNQHSDVIQKLNGGINNNHQNVIDQCHDNLQKNVIRIASFGLHFALITNMSLNVASSISSKSSKSSSLNGASSSQNLIFDEEINDYVNIDETEKLYNEFSEMLKKNPNNQQIKSIVMELENKRIKIRGILSMQTFYYKKKNITEPTCKIEAPRDDIDNVKKSIVYVQNKIEDLEKNLSNDNVMDMSCLTFELDQLHEKYINLTNDEKIDSTCKYSETTDDIDKVRKCIIKIDNKIKKLDEAEKNEDSIIQYSLLTHKFDKLNDKYIYLINNIQNNPQKEKIKLEKLLEKYQYNIMSNTIILNEDHESDFSKHFQNFMNIKVMYDQYDVNNLGILNLIRTLEDELNIKENLSQSEDTIKNSLITSIREDCKRIIETLKGIISLK